MRILILGSPGRSEHRLGVLTFSPSTKHDTTIPSDGKGTCHKAVMPAVQFCVGRLSGDKRIHCHGHRLIFAYSIFWDDRAFRICHAPRDSRNCSANPPTLPKLTSKNLPYLSSGDGNRGEFHKGTQQTNGAGRVAPLVSCPK